MPNPTPRPLTDGERTIARSVFGDTLALDDIRLTTAWWVLKGYAVSPNGWIYFHKDDFCADFSDKPLYIRAWLVHELTHVWQIQQGMAVVRRAIFNRKYNYTFKTGKSFFNYGIEQQARMVEDFYIQRELGKDCTAWRECVPFLIQSNHPSPSPDNSFASRPAELSVSPPTKSNTAIKP